MDALFFVNVGALVLFFMLFGSRFVLAPGLGVDFQIPTMAGSRAGAAPAEHVISVLPSGQVFADGLLNMPQLGEWLRQQARRSHHPTLLVRASVGVPVERITEITSLAQSAGFVRVVVGAEDRSVANPAKSAR